jgi:hypothetical protein
MTEAVAALTDAVSASDSMAAQQAAIGVARLAYDLQLQYRPVVAVDLDRLDLWALELMLDVEADDQGAFGADAFAMDIIRDRVVQALTTADRITVNEALGAIQAAVVDEDMGAGADAAAQLRAALAGIEPAS